MVDILLVIALSGFVAWVGIIINTTICYIAIELSEIQNSKKWVKIFLSILCFIPYLYLVLALTVFVLLIPVAIIHTILGIQYASMSTLRKLNHSDNGICARAPEDGDV